MSRRLRRKGEPTVISGLTSAEMYYFRFRALTRTGQRDYSQVVSLLVQ